MASTIKIKRSSVPNKVPTTSDINAGELALNLYDRKLYSSTGSAVFEIGNGVSNGSILGSYSSSPLGSLGYNANVVTSVTYTPANRYLQVANAVATYATKVSPTTSGILAHTGRATISTNLTVSGNTVVSGVVANGSLGTAGHYLRTNGTTTYWSPAAAGSSSGATWAALTSTNTAIRLLVSDRLQVANAAAIYQTKSVERAALANTNSRITLVNTNLTGTNTAIRTLVSDRLQVANASATYQTKTIERAALANTNAFINSQLANTNLRVNLINTNLTSTNTAIRLLVSDRLQVANAVATYQTKTVERAALANTNSRITLVNTNLTATNTAIRLSVSDRLQVANAVATYQTKTIERAALANTNAFIKSQLANTNLRVNLINTNLTSTNTAIRLLVSDRLQVANAVATYQTKTVERAALANTNAFIKSQLANTNLRVNLINTNLTGTNTAIRTLVSDRLQVANAVATYATKVSPTTSGVLAHTGRATISTNLTVSGNTVVSGVVANGSLGTSGHYLRTNGTTTYWSPAAAGSSSGASWAALTSTNTAIRTLVSDRLQVANAAATYATKASPTTSGVLAHTGRATISTNLTVSGNTVIGRLVANGSLGTSNYVLKSNGTTVFWGAAASGGSGSTPAYVMQSLGSLTRSSNVVTSITSLADGVAIAPSNLYLQVANAASYLKVSNAVSSFVAKTGSVIKTFNIVGAFNGPLVGTARFVPILNSTISTIQLTHGSTATSDIVVNLYKNGSLLRQVTLQTGYYTQTYPSLSYAITTSDYLTVSVVSGSGSDFSLVLSA